MSDDTAESSDSGGALMQLSVDAGQFLQKLTGGTLEEAGGLAGDWLRHQRLKLMVSRLEGARQMCREAGIKNPGEVALSTLAPWLEGASIEEDPELHEMWEALLANAGNPRDRQKHAHRSFVRLLKKVEPLELKVLEALYRIDDPEERTSAASRFSGYPNNDEILESMQKVGHEVSIAESELNIAKINLTRLGLCSRQRRAKNLELDEEPNRRSGRNSDSGTSNLSIKPRRARGGRGQVPEPAESQEGPPRIHINDFGRAFYEACQPPEPTPDTENN